VYYPLLLSTFCQRVFVHVCEVRQRCPAVNFPYQPTTLSLFLSVSLSLSRGTETIAQLKCEIISEFSNFPYNNKLSYRIADRQRQQRRRRRGRRVVTFPPLLSLKQKASLYMAYGITKLSTKTTTTPTAAAKTMANVQCKAQKCKTITMQIIIK